MTTTASMYFNRISVDFPRAGRDNDSQGFRDNFKNIFNAFSATNADIESLKLNAVTLGGINDFGYNVIRKASLQSYVTRLADYSPNATSGNINVDFREGNYQKYTLSSGNSTFLVQNWPETGFAQIKLSVTPASSSTTRISFGGNLTEIGSIELPLVTNSTDTQIFDLWTDNGGTDVYVQGVDITPVISVSDFTSVSTNTFDVSYTTGKYQKFTLLEGETVVQMTNWPSSTDTVALVTLSFKTTSSYTSTLTFTSGSATVEPVGNHTYPYTIDTTSTQFFEVWTDNGGSTVYVLKKGV